MSESKTYQLEEWRAEANKRFGPDAKNWKYKCCNCGHEQTINDFIKAGIKEPENKVYFSCIGRWTGGEGTMSNDKSPCNYTLGGLFKCSNVAVIDAEGNKHWVFDFAEPEKQEATMAPVTSIVTALALVLFLASCSPSRYLECPKYVGIAIDTIPFQIDAGILSGSVLTPYVQCAHKNSTCKCLRLVTGSVVYGPLKIDTVPSRILISRSDHHGFGHALDGYCVYKYGACSGDHLVYRNKKYIVLTQQYDVWSCKSRLVKGRVR